MIEHSEADCTCHFCEAIRTAQASFENLDAYAVRLRRERDDARQQLQGAVDLLREFTEHRADSSVEWLDGWTRRVDAFVASSTTIGGQSDEA